MSSSFPTSMITRIFPVSWFSRFKNKNGGFQRKTPVAKQSISGINDTDRDHGQSSGSRQVWNFDDLVLDMKKMKEKQNGEAYVEQGPDDSEKEIHVVESHITSNPGSIEKDCKIQAVKEMRRAKMKLKSKLPDDSFAVVKSSFNPEEDFRDSMVEMINERGIGLPEELLAGYLTMNGNEYHNLIIEVFKQVWLELYGIADDPETQNNQNCQHYKILHRNVSGSSLD